MSKTEAKAHHNRAGTDKSSPDPLPPLTDDLIESGADLSEYMTELHAVPPAMLDLTPQKVNVDFPAWVVEALDYEASRIGIPRQSLIKKWIVECLERGGEGLSRIPFAASHRGPLAR